MIRVTRLNGTQLWLNPLMIESVESHPDTVVTLGNGHKYVIRESPEDVAQAVAGFLRQIGLVASLYPREGEEA